MTLCHRIIQNLEYQYGLISSNIATIPAMIFIVVVVYLVILVIQAYRAFKIQLWWPGINLCNVHSANEGRDFCGEFETKIQIHCSIQ